MDGLTTVFNLAVAVKGAHDGVKGNKEQCKLLNDQVQVVATSLRGLPAATLKTKAVKNGVASLRETLRSALDLIGGFKKKNWFKKILSHSSTTEKFEALFVELDRVLAVCGFALNVRHFFLLFFFPSLFFLEVIFFPSLQWIEHNHTFGSRAVSVGDGRMPAYPFVVMCVTLR